MASTNASSLPTRSQIEEWSVEHLEAGAAWLPGHAEVWFDATETPWRAIERADWEGDAADAAREVYRSIKTQAHAGADHLESTARVLTQAALQISAAQQRATRAITDAETAGFSVSEDLKVSFDSTGLTAAEVATKEAELEQHASEILSAAINLSNTEESFARSITSATSLLEDLLSEPKSRSGSAVEPTVQATSFTPKLSPANTLPDNSGASAGSQYDDGPSSGQQDEGKTATDNQTDAEKSDQKTQTQYDDDEKSLESDDASDTATGSQYDDAPGGTTSADMAPDELSQYDSAPISPSPNSSSTVPLPPALPTPSAASSGGTSKAPLSPVSSLPSPSSLGSGASSTAGAGGQGVAPAALDKPVQAASSSLLNNAPAPFTPPPAASSAGSGPVAPMTPPPAVPVQQGAPLAGAPAAAPSPAAASPIASPTAGGSPTIGGGMLPPLMSSPAGGGVGGSPTPMTTPPAAPVTPAGAGAGVSAAASPIVPMTPAERVRANIARATGNTLGRIASDARALCAALHKATEKRQGLRWCVGGRADGVLLVSTNIGLGWVPNDVKLPAPDGVLSRGQHVFGHGSVPWSLRRDWIGHPVRAVRGYARATGEDVVVLTCFADAFDPQFDDIHGVQFDVVTEAQLPAVSILTGDDRLQTINRALADEIASEGVAALVTRLPSAMGGDDAAPDPAAAAGLWLNVTTSMAVSTDAHLEAWAAFCASQLASSAYYLRRADTVKLARQLYADYAYWQWNLDQIAQDANRVGSTT